MSNLGWWQGPAKHVDPAEEILEKAKTYIAMHSPRRKTLNDIQHPPTKSDLKPLPATLETTTASVANKKKRIDSDSYRVRKSQVSFTDQSTQKMNSSTELPTVEADLSNQVSVDD